VPTHGPYVSAYLSDFFANFYNTDVLGGTKISDQAVQASFNVGAASSPYATYACVDTWLTDFRADLPKIDVPVLVLHGTADRILPFENTAKRRTPGCGRHGPGSRSTRGCR
jgi:non-heme chloroperoxidase